MTTPTKKLVIRTQFRENYAAFNDDYEHGVSETYWKNKGGSTYVVYGITPAMETKIAHRGIPTLTDLIEFSDAYAEEYIISTDIVDKNEQVVEEWEHEIVLSYDKTFAVWRANIERAPYSPQIEYDRVSESWIMDEGNTRVEGSYHMLYRTPLGHWVTDEEIKRVREALEASYGF